MTLVADMVRAVGTDAEVVAHTPDRNFADNSVPSKTFRPLQEPTVGFVLEVIKSVVPLETGSIDVLPRLLE